MRNYTKKYAIDDSGSGNNDKNTKIVLDAPKATGILQNMYSATTSFSSAVAGSTAASNSCLQALASAGLESGFISSFDQGISNLINTFSTAINAMMTACESVNNIDLNIDDIIPKTKYNTSGTRSNNSGGSSGSSFDLAGEVSQIQIDEYSKMSLNDLSTISSVLQETANKYGISVEELLSNDAYKDVLKTTLLSCTTLSESFINSVSSEDSLITQNTLKNIITGQTNPEIMGINEDTILTLQKTLTNLNSDNYTLKDLVYDDKYENTLKTTLEAFSEINTLLGSLSSDNWRSEIEKIYNGTYEKDISKVALSIIKNNIDQCGGLDQGDSDKYTKNDLEALNKFALYMSNLNSSNKDAIKKKKKTVLGSSS